MDLNNEEQSEDSTRVGFPSTDTDVNQSSSPPSVPLQDENCVSSSAHNNVNTSSSTVDDLKQSSSLSQFNPAEANSNANALQSDSTSEQTPTDGPADSSLQSGTVVDQSKKVSPSNSSIHSTGVDEQLNGLPRPAQVDNVRLEESGTVSATTASENESSWISDAVIPITTKGSRQSACCPCRKVTVVGAMAVVVVLLSALIVAVGLGMGLGLWKGQEESPRRVAIGGVAADHTQCSEVGRDILARGGSAVDAAIAALLCGGVRQPHSMGIGGGLFMAVYKKSPRQVDMYNGRETAPLAATFDKYVNKSFLFGPLSIGVPGEVLTYWQAHQDHGRLAWKELFKPAIKMAADGHPLSRSAALALKFLQDRHSINLTHYPALCRVFCADPGTGKLKEEGARVVMPALARTLQGIADQGPKYLYSKTSTAAVGLIHDVQKAGGLMTLEDLANYTVDRAPPLSVRLGKLTLHTLTAPSGGPVLALVMQILHGLKMKSCDLEGPEKAAALWHRVVEAFKFAYADRLKLGDPHFVDIAQLLEKMASPEYVRKLCGAIDVTRTYDSSHYTNITAAPWREEGTTHLSVIGPDGDAVSATSTINYYFGSLIMSPSTGIILNNEMADFSTPSGPILDKLKPTSPNYIQPGKRPLSSMAPAVIVDKAGNPVLVLGSAGGARITTVNAQVIARILWLKQSLKDAINAKRLHHQLFPNVLDWEFDYPKAIRERLLGYGHVMKERKTYMAVVQAVSRDPSTGEVTAFSDPRKHAEARQLYKVDTK